MKKLMKAIAFATVMCMLLSVSAFAEEVVTNPKATLDPEADYNLTVEVTASGTEQVALLVLKAGTELSEASDTTIYYIDQDAATEGKATFDVMLNKDTLGSETKVDVYAGYASNGANPAVSVKGVDVVNATELAIVLNALVKIPDVEAEAEYTNIATDKKAESDIGGLVYATVELQNKEEGKAITNVGWEFANGDNKRYIDYEVSGYEVLNGNVQLGVAFTNGNGSEERPMFMTESTEVNLWLKVEGQEKGMQAIPKAE